MLRKERPHLTTTEASGASRHGPRGQAHQHLLQVLSMSPQSQRGQDHTPCPTDDQSPSTRASPEGFNHSRPHLISGFLTSCKGEEKKSFSLLSGTGFPRRRQESQRKHWPQGLMRSRRGWGRAFTFLHPSGLPNFRPNLEALNMRLGRNKTPGGQPLPPNRGGAGCAAQASASADPHLPLLRGGRSVCANSMCTNSEEYLHLEPKA